MQIQLILVCILLSFSAFATDEKSMDELFSKYDSVMNEKRIDLIDDVFTRKFITNSGGKESLIQKIQALKTDKKISDLNWRKGRKGKTFFAKLKLNKKKESGSEFIIVEEDGKVKIDGTLSDGN